MPRRPRERTRGGRAGAADTPTGPGSGPPAGAPNRRRRATEPRRNRRARSRRLPTPALRGAGRAMHKRCRGRPWPGRPRPGPAARAGGARVHDPLHVGHDVVVEDAVEHAHLQRCGRVLRDQANGARMVDLKMLDDRARFHHRPVAIHEQRELGRRPKPGELGAVLGVVGAEHPEREWDRVLVERDKDLLVVGREGVAEERQRHGAGISLAALAAPSGRAFVILPPDRSFGASPSPSEPRPSPRRRNGGRCRRRSRRRAGRRSP